MKNPILSLEEFNKISKECLTIQEIVNKCGFCGKSYRKSNIEKINNYYNCDIYNIISENQREFNKHICKNCGKEFYEKHSKYASWDFCSQHCASQYSQSFIDRDKISSTLKNGIVTIKKKRNVIIINVKIVVLYFYKIKE